MKKPAIGQNREECFDGMSLALNVAVAVGVDEVDHVQHLGRILGAGPDANLGQRYHLHESVVQRAVTDAGPVAGLTKRVIGFAIGGSAKRITTPTGLNRSLSTTSRRSISARSRSG